MLKTYDTASEAFVEHSGKIYSESSGAWIDAPNAKAYDTPSESWIDRLQKSLEATVTDGFYNNSGNLVLCGKNLIHAEVKPTSEDINVTFSLKEDFTNPVISFLFSLYNSDLCPSIADGFRSHACVNWYVKGYKNGVEVASNNVVGGNSYAYSDALDVSKTVTLTGTFDEIRLICRFSSFTNYSSFGRARTTIDNFSIDGKFYNARQTFSS